MTAKNKKASACTKPRRPKDDQGNDEIDRAILEALLAGKRCDQIAEDLHVTEDVVKVRISRMRKRRSRNPTNKNT